MSPRDGVEVAFEEICNRFNLFLARTNDRAANDQRQRGLIVMDEMKHEKPLQMLARKYRVHGARWGHFRNLAEVPFFVDSKASRGVQLADLVAWATLRKYEHQDGRFFDPLVRSFDAQGVSSMDSFTPTPINSTVIVPVVLPEPKETPEN